MKLTGVQVSLLLSRDMNSSHLSNESQYPCDEHITETTETEATVCQSLSKKMQHLGSLIYYPFVTVVSNGPFYFLTFIISSFSEYQIILILAVTMKPDGTFEF
jgi:hypothetical protein